MRMVIQPTDPAGHTGSTEYGRWVTQGTCSLATSLRKIEDHLLIPVLVHCRLLNHEGIEGEEDVVDHCRLLNHEGKDGEEDVVDLACAW